MNYMKFILMLGLLLGVQAAQAQQVGQLEASRAIPHVIVVFDDSGSMDSAFSANRSISKLEGAKQALIAVLANVDPKAEVGVLLLNGQYDPQQKQNVRWWIPLGKINHATAVKRIEELKTNGGTPLGAAMKDGADALIEAKAKDHFGSYRLLVVTDGEATDAHYVESYTPDIMKRGFITVDVIGVDMQANHTLATRVHSYRNAADKASLEKAIKSVFAESSRSDPNSAEDYALTALLPEDVAKSALKSLNETGTYPVGQAPQVSIDTEGNVQVTPAVANDSGIGWFWIVGGVVVAAIFLGIVIKAIGNSSY